jgi:plastocyanin domain-containing protein
MTMNRERAWKKIVAVALLFAAAGCASGGGPPAGREVRITVTEEGFTPEVVEIPKNEAVTLVVTRKYDRTCATEMVFAHNGERHDLPFGQVVRIELPAGQPDTLHYACAMDMYKGTIVAK